LIILAGLFNAEAELQYAQSHREECLGYSRKALILFEFIDMELKTYSPDRISKMEVLRMRIKELK